MSSHLFRFVYQIHIVVVPFVILSELLIGCPPLAKMEMGMGMGPGNWVVLGLELLDLVAITVLKAYLYHDRCSLL